MRFLIHDHENYEDESLRSDDRRIISRFCVEKEKTGCSDTCRSWHF